MFTLLDSQKNSAHRNMEMDAQLLESMQKEPKAILHLYDWKKPSITHGIFLKPENFLNLDAIQNHGIEVAKRPTGGGMTLHLSDLAFSVIVPKNHPYYVVNTLDCYLRVNEKVSDAFVHFFGKDLGFSFQPIEIKAGSAIQNFCMAKPTKYDVMVQGKKIGGAAQRKTKWGFLHQGTISLGLLSDKILDELLLQKEVIQAMLENSFAPLGSNWDDQELLDARKGMKEALIQTFCNE